MKKGVVAFRPWAEYVNLSCSSNHNSPAAMVSPTAIFLLINKFELARDPKLFD